MHPYRTADVTFSSLLAADCAERLLLLACAAAMTAPNEAKAYAEAALSEAKLARRPDITINVLELLGAL